MLGIAAVLLGACGGSAASRDGSVDASPDAAPDAIPDASSDGATTDAPIDAPVADGTSDMAGTGCNDNGDCDPVDEYCAFRSETCAAPGRCARREVPVCHLLQECGCDGTVYASDCDRATAGVSEADIAACGCCYADADCPGLGPAAQRCHGRRGEYAGRCKIVPGAGSCWSQRDCSVGQICSGAFVCDCGALCFAPDMMGSCVDVL